MDADDYSQLGDELGFCACHGSDSTELLRELLEIGEMRLFETDDEDERRFDLWLAETRLKAALPHWPSRNIVLGCLGASLLILHSDDAIGDYWLDERGEEALEYLRGLDAEQERDERAKAN